MNKTGIAVFYGVIDQFLYNPEYQQFLVGSKPYTVIMKPYAGIEVSAAVYFIKQVGDSTFQS